MYYFCCLWRVTHCFCQSQTVCDHPMWLVSEPKATPQIFTSASKGLNPGSINFLRTSENVFLFSNSETDRRDFFLNVRKEQHNTGHISVSCFPKDVGKRCFLSETATGYQKRDKTRINCSEGEIRTATLPGFVHPNTVPSALLRREEKQQEVTYGVVASRVYHPPQRRDNKGFLSTSEARLKTRDERQFAKLSTPLCTHLSQYFKHTFPAGTSSAKSDSAIHHCHLSIWTGLLSWRVSLHRETQEQRTHFFQCKQCSSSCTFPLLSNQKKSPQLCTSNHFCTKPPEWTVSLETEGGKNPDFSQLYKCYSLVEQTFWKQVRWFVFWQTRPLGLLLL